MIPHPKTISQFVRDLAAAEALVAVCEASPELDEWSTHHLKEANALACASVDQPKSERVRWLTQQLQEAARKKEKEG